MTDIVRRLVNGIWTTEAADAGGGGSSLPDEWTVGADGSLDIAISDSSGLLTLKRGSGSGSFVQSGVIDQGGGIEDAIIRVTGIGGGGGCAILVANGSAAGTSTTIDGDGRLALFTTAGEGAIEAWDDAGNTLRFALLPAGQPMIGVLAAPADGDLSAGQVALWFDATDGAAKLKIKGKSADGTVVSGEVALAP